MTQLNSIRTLFVESIALKQKILETDVLETLSEIANMIADSIANGGRLYLCGNGGSAADAQHLAAELLIRLRSSVNRDSLPALTLATDMSSVTACGNDYGFDDIFARPLAGLGRAGDVLLGITTSGRSPNVIKAFEKAREMGIKTVGFLGGTGDPARAHCDLAFVVPSMNTGRVQEVHITAGHALMETIEDQLLVRGVITTTK
ncbi:MAG: SIS domain-containing protein [Pseudomonadota bacterium]